MKQKSHGGKQGEAQTLLYCGYEVLLCIHKPVGGSRTLMVASTSAGLKFQPV